MRRQKPAANRLVVLRAERNRLSQSALAKMIGISRDRYLRIETEVSRATPAECVALAAALTKVGTVFRLRRVTVADLGLSPDDHGATRGPRPAKKGRTRSKQLVVGAGAQPATVQNFLSANAGGGGGEDAMS